jgi:hypothetical protein
MVFPGKRYLERSNFSLTNLDYTRERAGGEEGNQEERQQRNSNKQRDREERSDEQK